jgi:hypothetical protein
MLQNDTIRPSDPDCFILHQNPRSILTPRINLEHQDEPMAAGLVTGDPGGSQHVPGSCRHCIQRAAEAIPADTCYPRVTHQMTRNCEDPAKMDAKYPEAGGAGAFRSQPPRAHKGRLNLFTEHRLRTRRALTRDLAHRLHIGDGEAARLSEEGNSFKKAPKSREC